MKNVIIVEIHTLWNLRVFMADDKPKTSPEAAANPETTGQRPEDLPQELESLRLRLKKSEEELSAVSRLLKERDEQLQGIYASARDAIIVMDNDGCVAFCNLAAEKMFGYTYGEIAGKDVHKLLAPERYHAAFETNFTKYRETGEGSVVGKTVELTAIHKNRREFPIELSISVVKIKGLWHAIGMVRDITLTKRVETSLQEAEKRFRSAFNYAPIGMAIVGLDGRWLKVNKALCDILGYTEEEMLLTNFQALTHPDDIGKSNEYARRVTSTDLNTVQFEKRYIRKSGSIVWVNLNIAIVRDETGTPLYYITQVQDISEKITAREELKESEKRYRQLVEFFPDAVIVETDGKLDFINPAGAKLLGTQSPDQLIGRSLAGFVHPKLRIALKEHLKNVTVSGESSTAGGFTWETRLISMDGQELYVETSSIPFAFSGRAGTLTVARDLTAKRQAENACLRSEALYHTLISNFPNGAVLLFDFHLRLTIADGSGLKDMGYSTDTLEGKSIWEAFPEDVSSNFEARFRSALKGRPVVFEQTFGDRVYQVRVIPVKNDVGETYAGMAVAQDMTGRKRIEEQLKRNQDDLELKVKERTTDLMAANVAMKREVSERKRAELKVVRLNRVYHVLSGINEAIIRIRQRDILFEEACKIAVIHGAFRLAWIGLMEDADGALPVSGDISPKACYGSTHESHTSPSVCDEKACQDCELLRDNILNGKNFTCNDIESKTCPQSLKFSAIKHGYSSMAAFPLKVESRTRGAMVFYSGEVHFFDNEEVQLLDQLAGDISFAMEFMEKEEHRRLTDELVRKLSLAVEQSPSTVMITDTDGYIEYVNPKFTQITGYSAEEVKGKKPGILKSGNTTRQEYENLWNTIKAGREWVGEFQNKKKNGEFFWEQAIITSIKNSRGEITHFLAVKENVTERKKLEEQLRQSQKMEAIGQLAGGIAHDFNNILSAIIGYIYILQMKMDASDPLRTYADQILSSSDRAVKLIQSLLTFSRKQQIATEPINLNEIIKTSEKLLSRLIGEDLLFVTGLGNEEMVIMADGNQLIQVLMNLATNARDAMPKGGTFTISTSCEELDVTFMKTHGYGTPGTYACVTVSDTGVGIDKKTMEKIFEPFFTTKEVGKGTGLGLAMVYGIVKQHGGYINIYSEPGNGTVFKIYFPTIHVKAEKPAPPSYLPPTGGEETILLAEDDHEFRRIMKEILEGANYKIIEAVDGQDAVEKFALYGQDTDILILDVIMPKKNGKAAFDEIRVKDPSMKAIFISGYTYDVITQRGILEKDINFLSKPIAPMDLLRKVREVLTSG
ncbi:MAG: PAS domain S-box protein [Nitrospirae bacterium]|nr:PAS domain S-box protein [Nitrospirota bacterium]